MSILNSQQTSLKKECYLLSGALVIFILILSLVVYIFIYIYNEKAKKHIYTTEAELIESSLNEDINYLSHYMKFIGEKIVNSKDTSVEYIESIISNKLPNNILNNDFSSWTLFDWVNNKNFLVANSLHGKFKDPINMSGRKHLEKTPLKPWKLQFADPVIGIPSGQRVIPIGMGIENQNKFFGTLVTGLDLNKLNIKINNIADKNEIDFLIIDIDCNIIAHSLNLKNLAQNKNLKSDFSKNTSFLSNDSGFFNNKVILNGTEFLYYKKLSLYPYYLIIGKNTSLINKELFESIVPRIIELSFLGIFAICLLFYFRYKIIGPISELANTASKIANEKNHQNISIHYIKYVELNILAKRIDEIQLLKLQLMNSKELIEQANELLEYKVIERTFELEKANKKIKQINNSLEYKVIERTSELQKALDAKTEFLNNMSHEIRTPVQGIIGISQGLSDNWEACTNEERKFYAQKIAESGNRLFSLVSNLLDLAECNAGSMQFYMEQEDLIELTQAMIEESKDLYIRDKEIELQFETSLSRAILICDHERILQVLRNIFANAIKFTAKGKIIARLEECVLTYDNGLKQEGYHFSLSDEGIGIPIGEEASIFDLFTQSTRTKTRAGGTGLGLAICKDIIDAHNGRIWACNNETIGTTIYFEIPKKFSNAHSVLQLNT